MGEKVITLTKDNSSLEINQLGARIAKLVLNGTEVLSTVTRGDSKQAMSHPCSPIFGPETTTHYQLSQHGPARQTLFTIEDQRGDELLLSCFIEEGMYPKGLKLSLKFTLTGNSFTLISHHENSGEVPMPVNFCNHFYWYAPHGFEGITINGEDVTEVVKADKVIPLRDENQIQIPGQPKMVLTQKNFPLANLWAYPGDTKYVCIEPCEGENRSPFFGSEASLIQPGKERTNTVTISTEK